MSNAIPSQGIKLQRDAGGNSFTTIAEITSFTGPTESAKQVDVTSVDSTAREYLPGLRDGGEVSFEMNFVPGDAAQQGLRTDLTNRVTGSYKLVLTDDIATPTEIAFSAVVTSLSMKGAVDDKIAASCTLKLIGPAVFTYHS